MKSAFASIAALLISVFILLVGSGLQATLVPLAANEYGFADVLIGVIGSSYFAGMMIGCFTAPWLISRTGHIRAFAACTALTTGAAIFYALAVDPIVWNVLRCLTGACLAILYATIESWLNDKTDNTSRGSVLATYNVINYAGMATGQQFLRLFPPAGFQLFSVSALLISLAAIPIALTRSPSPPVPRSPRLKIRWLIALSPVSVVCALVMGMTIGSLWTLGPLFATLKGLSATDAGGFVSAAMIGAVTVLWPAGWLSDRVDRRAVIVGCCFVAALAGAGLAVSPDNARWLLFALAFLYGASALPVYALSSAHAADHAEPGDMVQVSTGMILTFTTGAVAGPTVAATLMEFTVPGAMFVMTASLHVGLASFVLYRLTRRAPVPLDEREPFVPVPRTSPAVSELDPRLPPEPEETDTAAQDNTVEKHENSP